MSDGGQPLEKDAGFFEGESSIPPLHRKPVHLGLDTVSACTPTLFLEPSRPSWLVVPRLSSMNKTLSNCRRSWPCFLSAVLLEAALESIRVSLVSF